mmetsp:Transcript_26324/g.88207  ORF Transcript_26324/g.88207 Transcript_26324/m.88207 type:complete len:206 (-) Transcript_26324:1241-1858(-)
MRAEQARHVVEGRVIAGAACLQHLRRQEVGIATMHAVQGGHGRRRRGPGTAAIRGAAVDERRHDLSCERDVLLRDLLHLGDQFLPVHVVHLHGARQELEDVGDHIVRDASRGRRGGLRHVEIHGDGLARRLGHGGRHVQRDGRGRRRARGGARVHHGLLGGCGAPRIGPEVPVHVKVDANARRLRRGLGGLGPALDLEGLRVIVR